MIWRSILYDYPSAAFLLFFTPFLVWSFLALYRYRQKILKRFAEPDLLVKLVDNRSTLLYGIKSGLCCFIWICCIIALMQPKGNERYVKSSSETTETDTSSNVIRKKLHEVIFLIDTSASMAVVDGYGGNTRLNEAKEIAETIINGLKGENVSLYAFTSVGMQIVPSTNDYLFARLMLKQLEINEGETAGTNITKGLEMLSLAFSSIPKTIILLSDGGDTDYESSQGDARQQVVDAMLKPLQNAKQNHVQLLAIGIGSNSGKNVPGVTYQGHPVLSSVDERLLHILSESGNGQLFMSNQTTPSAVAEAVVKFIMRANKYVDSSEISAETTKEHVYDLYYQIPLGLALIAFAFFLLLPNTTVAKRVDAA